MEKTGLNADGEGQCGDAGPENTGDIWPGSSGKDVRLQVGQPVVSTSKRTSL